ncbi:MAG: hypothetical protein ABFS09_13250, partial [Thermodesulfobacteriota bacterium]
DATCGDPMGMGWSTLGDCVDFMANTFDAGMGFPAGTAAMMGMNDGIAGLQGFTVRETVSGATLNCNPFAGAASMSPFPGYSVNNCMPSNNPMFTMGSCVGAVPASGIPGQCDANSFRANGACMDNADCNGVPFSAEEYAANPNGLLYQRSEVRSHFKIALQQSDDGAGPKVTWPIKVEKNPSNPSHVNAWDQALTDCKDMFGMPAPCGDGMFIDTTVHANQLLGYDSAMLAFLLAPKTRDNFTVTSSAGPGGSIAPAGAVEVDANTDYTVYISAIAGYHIADVLVDGVSVGAVSSYTFNAVLADHTIAASFAENPSYTISATAGLNGTISPAGDTVALGGTDVTFTITPAAGYKLASLTVDGQPQLLWNSFTFHDVAANHTINATFEQDVTYTITATAYYGGTITPAGSVAVSKGGSQTFTITPNAGYKVGRVVVDGRYKGAITSYTFDNVTYNGHYIKVWFYRL